MAKGGPEKMLSDSYWTLPAEELWEMGYRKCNDEAEPIVIDTRSGIPEIACPSGQVTEPCR
jgi:hypothetical protein